MKYYILIIGRLRTKTSFPVCGFLIRVKVAGARAGRSQAVTSCTGEGHRTKLVHQVGWEMRHHDERHLEGTKPNNEIKQRTGISAWSQTTFKLKLVAVMEFDLGLLH